VPVVYGLLANRPNGPNYPQSNKFKIGGCQIGAVKIAKVLYCPECRSADPDWDPKQAQLSWNPSPEQIKVEQFCIESLSMQFSRHRPLSTPGHAA